MRGLKRLTGVKAGGTAVAGLAALSLSLGALAACTTGGTGARDEGPARGNDPMPQTSASASPSPSTAARVDAVALIKRDPKVSATVKADLKPCVADEYPVDVSYGNLTGGPRPDVVINVLTCGDAVGVGSYVYRAEGKKYKNVFTVEEPPVYAEIDRGDLIVTKQLYGKRDPVAFPSGEEVITYRWQGAAFAEQDRIKNDYGNAAGDDAPAPEEN